MLGPVTETRLECSIPKEFGGYYTESIVINGTRNPIIIVDNNNRRVEIAPDDSHQNNCVVVIERSNNGPRRLREKTRWVEKPIVTKTTRIPAWYIESGFYHYEAGDILITTTVIGSTLMHPRAKSAYLSTVEEVAKRVNADGLHTSMQFFINDPSSRHKTIFGCIGSAVFELQCTNEADSDSGDIPSLTVVATSNKDVYIHDRKDISSLFEDGHFSSEMQGGIISLGLTPNEALDANKTVANERAQMATHQINKRVIDARVEFEEKLTHLKAESTSTIEALKLDKLKAANKIAAHEAKISSLELELSAVTIKAEEYRKMFEMRKEIEAANMKVQAAIDNQREQEAKTRRAEIALEHEDAKLSQTTIKYACGFIFGIALPWVAKKYAQK